MARYISKTGTWGIRGLQVGASRVISSGGQIGWGCNSENQVNAPDIPYVLDYQPLNISGIWTPDNIGVPVTGIWPILAYEDPSGVGMFWLDFVTMAGKVSNYPGKPCILCGTPPSYGDNSGSPQFIDRQGSVHIQGWLAGFWDAGAGSIRLEARVEIVASIPGGLGVGPLNWTYCASGFCPRPEVSVSGNLTPWASLIVLGWESFNADPAEWNESHSNDLILDFSMFAADYPA